MDKTCKYYQYQRYVSYDNGQTWQPMNQFQRGELMEFNSPDCGAGVDALYKWVLMDVNTDYYCDECPEDSCTEPQAEYIEAWSLFSSSDCGDDYYICSGTTKYYKEVKQISYDSGLTWTTPTPIEVRPSSIAIEYYSTDCGFEPSYRWHTVPITEEYICSGGSMYYKEYYQISNDGQQTWNNVIPTSSRTGSMYSECAAQCGCGILFTASYSDSSEYSVNCIPNETNEITSAITRGYSTSYSSMTSANIGYCCPSINTASFEDCVSLSSVTIPSSVSYIGVRAFNGCSSLKSVNLPSSVNYIGMYAFEGCSSLSSITINSETPPSGSTPFGEGTVRPLIYVPCNSFGLYYENDNYNTNSNYKELLRPINDVCDNIRWVDYSAECVNGYLYNNQKLQYTTDSGATWKDTVITRITGSSIDVCTSDKIYLTYSDSSSNSAPCDSNTKITSGIVESLGDKYSIISAVIGTCADEISDRAFYQCSAMTSVNIPITITKIGNYSFGVCNALKSVILSDSIISIGTGAFSDCKSLSSATIVASSGISDSILNRCYALKTVNIDTPRVRSLSNYALTNLENVIFGDRVRSIDSLAFSGYTSITNVTIPSGVTDIGSSAFKGCSGLTAIYCYPTIPPSAGSLIFEDTNNFPIYVPAASLNAYKTATGWSTYASRITSL